MRTSTFIILSNPKEFKSKLLNWSQQFSEVVFLDSNDYPDRHSKYDCLLAADAFTSIKTDYFSAFDDLKQYQQITNDWLFGYLTYDLKNDIDSLVSENFDGLEFPDLYFFQPKKLFLLKGNQLEVKYLNVCDDEVQVDCAEIIESKISNTESNPTIAIQQRVSKESYLQKVSGLLGHIQHGDIYEANFCMEFYAENAVIDPQIVYSKLNQISQTPFTVFFKNKNQYLLSASPERYLKKQGETIISQPIKGTSKRFLDPMDDEISKNNLSTDPKERAENIMITDLVRNDLSRTAQKGSVQVDEMCKVYSFLQVHQMISTVSSQLDPIYSAVDLIKTTFPMGSMTGAPKLSAMKIIEEFEETKRGLYSGSVGYFTPEGDFDFNVVIRSILYNQENKYLSFSVGSAITSLSIPENEYQECLLKAKAMREVVN